jgi:predicted HAD superfamily phosphohydrolase
MTVRKRITRPGNPRHIRGERFKDEVYRQMFRLEERRPGAEMGLALALLRAWLAADSKPDGSEEREWLKKVSQICLQMTETALQTGSTPPSGVQ